MPRIDTYKNIRAALRAVAPDIRFTVGFGNPEDQNYRNNERTVEVSYNADLLAQHGIRQAQLRDAVMAVLAGPHPDRPLLSRVSFYPWQPEPVRVNPEKVANLTAALRTAGSDATDALAAATLIKLLPHVDAKTAALLQSAAINLNPAAPIQQQPAPPVPVELGGQLEDLPEYRAPLCPICGDNTDDGAHPDEGYCERMGVHYIPETGEIDHTWD